MSTSLCFNKITLTPVTHQSNLWIRATELAHALGYRRADILNKLYTTHADEFTQDMTQVVEIVDNTESVFPVKLRIFSLRGCHLIAMFARTPVAKQFRRWVLDVLDKLAAEERALHCGNVNPQSLTPAEQAQLHAIVAAKVGMLPKESQRKAYAEIWSRFGRHFQVAKYQQLPPARMGEAVEYLVGVEIKAAPKALPPAPQQHLFDRLGLSDWEKVQMGPSIRRMAEDERELGPKTVECILLKARYLKAIEDVHRLGNALFADLGKAENGVAKVVYQAVNKTGALADPFFDTLYDDRYRLVKIAGDFFDTACRALNSRICLAKMQGM